MDCALLASKLRLSAPLLYTGVMKVALATCRKLPEPDADEALLVGALERLGAEVRMLAWDDEASRPVAGELIVVRSTWNYYGSVHRFMDWIDRASATTLLFNPAPIIRANVRKTYLRDLQQRGIDVVPTIFAERGDRIEDLARAENWNAVVVKPVVSAGSFRTQRFDSAALEDAQRFLDDVTSAGEAMIQRYVPSVETYGERSLVWIDGALTHAIRKAPRFASGSEAVSGEMPIADDERAFALRVLEPLRDSLLYARVDVVRDDGTLRLMELELIEPSLFLAQCPRALTRLAEGIVARASKS
jgi:glutathione synthase/RimK-type ligase-like ATP-grasp enzyme